VTNIRFRSVAVLPLDLYEFWKTLQDNFDPKPSQFAPEDRERIEQLAELGLIHRGPSLDGGEGHVFVSYDFVLHKDEKVVTVGVGPPDIDREEDGAGHPPGLYLLAAEHRAMQHVEAAGSVGAAGLPPDLLPHLEQLREWRLVSWSSGAVMLTDRGRRLLAMEPNLQTENVRRYNLDLLDP